jgi:hypothetical protein
MITDFEAGQDVIDLTTFDIGTIGLGKITSLSGSVLQINFGNGDVLSIDGLSPSDLPSSVIL